MQPEDFLEVAKVLAANHPNKPKQVFLRRAMSTTYYAMFHSLCALCADMLVRKQSLQAEKSRAWVQTYRALDHKKAYDACKKIYADDPRLGFPPDIKNFAGVFASLQDQRHQADYHPTETFTKQEILDNIKAAEASIEKLSKTSPKHKNALAVFITLPRRQQREFKPKKA